MSVSTEVVKPATQRFVVLDFYRYVAAVGVFLFHVKLFNPDSPIPAIGSYGLFVDMFFILSGFVIYFTYRDKVRDRQDYRTFVVKRIARVYPLHIIMLVLFVCVDGPAGNVPVGSSPLREFVVNALLLQSWGFSSDLAFNTPAWSISAELGCYLLFPLIAIAVSRMPLLLSFALVGACYVIGGHGHVPIWANSHSQMLGATYDYGVLRALTGFSNGVVLCRLYTTLKPHGAYLVAGVAAMVCAIVIMNVFAKGDLVILLMAGATIATALGESALPRRAALTKIFEWFGNTSYAIYMLHMALTLWVVGPVLRASTLSEGEVCAVLLAFIIGLTIVSHFVFVVVEAPARKWVTRSFKRRSERLTALDSYPVRTAK